MITHYLRVAIRHILKYKMQNLISIIGLSVGILCFSICLYCSRYIYDTDKCFNNYARIVDINMMTPDDGPFSGLSATVIENLRQRPLEEVEAYTYASYLRERNVQVEVSGGKELPYTLMTMEVDSLFNRVFTPQILQGSWEVASQTTNAVVLPRSIAEKMFSKDENPIGKRITLLDLLFTAPSSTPKRGGIVYTIQAVIEDIPINTSLTYLNKVEMLTLNDNQGLLQSERRHTMSGGNGHALLRPDYTAKDLEAHLRTLDIKYNLYNQELNIVANPFGKIYWENSVAPYFANITLILGVLILLTGLLNFFQFLIGTYFNRRREYGIRKVTGGTMTQLFIQLSVQAALISLFAFLITFCLIEIFSPSLHFSMSGFELDFDKNTLMIHAAEYMTGILLLGMLLSGLTAWRVRKVTVMVGMNANTTRGGKNRTRNILLGVQFFICFLFVTGTAALYLQAQKTSNTLFNTLNRQEKSEILSIEMNYPFMKHEEKLALIDRIAAHSGVIEKLPADINLIGGISGNTMFTEKDNENSYIQVNIMSVPKHFFTFMNIPIRTGRPFRTTEDMVADQALVDFMKKDLMGMTLYNYTGGHTVCGISEEIILDVHNNRNGFVFLFNDFQEYVGHCYFKCTPDRTAEVKAHIEKTLREALPESIEIKVNTLLDDIIEAQPIENNLKGIILFFSIVSLLITLLGVYSAITLDTERRQKEVAIRKVNGAGMKQIVLLFARLYITLLVITAGIALPIGYAVTLGMKQIYTVFFNNGPTFWISIFLFVAAITTLTVLFRILKIARINPAEVIKNE